MDNLDEIVVDGVDLSLFSDLTDALARLSATNFEVVYL